MITTLAQRISFELVSRNVIEEDDVELFSYGLFIFLSNFLFLSEILIFGVIFRELREAVIFYFSFSALRGYAGGIHARKERTCVVCTSFVMAFSMFTIKALESMRAFTVYMSCLMLGTLSIFLLCPFDSPEKALDPEDYKHCRKISMLLSLLVDCTIIVTYEIGLYGVCAALSTAILLEGSLLFTGIIKKSLFPFNF